MGVVIQMKKVSKKELRGTGLVAYYANNSRMEVDVLPGEPLPASVIITITGECRHLPNMKNNRRIHNGRTYIAKDAMARIKALDVLWREKYPNGDGPSFGANDIVVIVACAEKSRRFDPIGCQETVNDWLEPRVKNKKDRGWGVGVVADDCYIASHPRRSWQLCTLPDRTMIVIAPYLPTTQEDDARYLSRRMIGA
jgi:hypothetical protein